MTATVEKNIIGTVTHQSGKRAEIERATDGRILFSIFDREENLIHTGVSASPRLAGYTVGFLMTIA